MKAKPTAESIPPFRVAEMRRAVTVEWRPLANIKVWVMLSLVAICSALAFSGRTGRIDLDMQMEIVKPAPPPQKEEAAPHIVTHAETKSKPPIVEEQVPHEEKTPGPVPAGHVRIAAAQMYSAMGAVAENRQRMAEIIRKAAALEVKIIVFPEACIHGYADIAEGVYWTKGIARELPLEEKKYDERPPSPDDPAEYRAIADVAESADGESVRFVGALAKELDMYITAPILERAGDRFYSASLLIDPQGKAILHWRKTALWSPGDSEWASPGDLLPAVVETPYGRIGLMIGLEYPTLLPKLAGQKVDILLYSCAFYGVNFESFLRSRRFLDPIKQGRIYMALANWTVRDIAPWWEGYGMSRIVLPTGLTKRIRFDRGDGLVIADIPVPYRGTMKTLGRAHGLIARSSW